MDELDAGSTIHFPSRWVLNVENPAQEIDRLAQVVNKGIEALSGVYFRMCQCIRDSELTDDQVREVLRKHFPEPRVSEILRVARAPDNIYRRYEMGFFGFKAALQECRGYTVTPSDTLKQKRIRRTAERLVLLLNGPATLRVRDHTIRVEAKLSDPSPVPPA